MPRKLLILILIITFLLVGCYNKYTQVSNQNEKRIVLGFSQLGDESEWRSSLTNSVKHAAEKAQIQAIFEDALQKQDNQIKAIRSFIVNRFDVIAFCPIVEEGWDDVLLEARSANIPVIIVDRHIKTNEKGLYSAFIGSDFKAQGEKAGRWLISKFKDSNEPIKIVEISGTPNSTPSNDRHTGFIETLKDELKFKIVRSISGDFMRSKGRECMEIILNEYIEFDVLFAHNDDMAIGAIEVLEEHGLMPGKDVVIISVDAQKSGLQALKDGKINCLVECNPYIGDELMDLVLKAANNEELPHTTYTVETIFTEDDNLANLPIRP